MPSLDWVIHYLSRVCVVCPEYIPEFLSFRSKPTPRFLPPTLLRIANTRRRMGDSGSATGFLSPRRLEAIHISFNRVFDSALKDGLIRNAGTYPSLDQVAVLSDSLSASRKRKRDEIPVVPPQRSPSPETADDPEPMQLDPLPPLDDEPLPTFTAPAARASPVVEIKQPSSTNITSSPTSNRKPTRKTSLLKKPPAKRTPPSGPPHKRKYGPTKRYRRPADEIDRRFKCDYQDCDKGYGYLHHLNTHREQARHGPKLTLDGACPCRHGVLI